MNLSHFNYLCIKVDKTASTNDLMWDYFKNMTVNEGTIILAKNQTNGKGQSGNTWLVESGKNLTISIALLPNIQAKHAFYLNIIASLAVQKTLADHQINAEIKWPNDIFVNEKKICGILVENQIQGGSIYKSVVGIGLNVNQTIFHKNIQATSMGIQSEKMFPIESIAKTIHQHLDSFYGLLKTQNFKLLQKLYFLSFYRLNTPHKYKDKEGEFLGCIIGMDDFGRLKVRKENNKTYTYDIKEITYL